MKEIKLGQRSGKNAQIIEWQKLIIENQAKEIEELKNHKKHLNEIITKQANQIEKLLEKKL